MDSTFELWKKFTLIRAGRETNVYINGHDERFLNPIDGDDGLTDNIVIIFGLLKLSRRLKYQQATAQFLKSLVNEI